MTLTLVIGGTRSGKSAHAERLAHVSGLPVRYVATADAGDPAMAERISAHAARRPDGWATVEAGPRLADALADAERTCVLVDGLGVWIAGAMHAGEDVPAQIEELLRVADATPGAEVIVVAEQAGEGLLPADRVSREWLDMLGEATQRLAAGAARVELVVAGRALSLAGAPLPGVGADAGAPDIERHDLESGAVGAGDASRLRVHGDRAVRPGDADHAVNVIAGGPPEWLRSELRAALEQDACRYPDERAAADALAALHGRDAEEIVPTNGGAEALWLIPAALRPALAACVHPGFTEAEAALRAHGVPVVRVLRERERGFALDPGAVPAEADVVIVGNPASPSGTLDPAAALLALRRPGRVLVVDEAFMDLVPGEPATLVRERLDDVIVVRSITKALSIPGLRAGYAVAPPRWRATARSAPTVVRERARARCARRRGAPPRRARRDRRARDRRARGSRTPPGGRRRRAHVAVGCQLLPGRGRRRPGGAGSAARAPDRGARRRILPGAGSGRPARDRARARGQRALGCRARRGGGRGGSVEQPRDGFAGRGVSASAPAPLVVVGIGADGWAGLGEAARAAVLAAGGDRRVGAAARAAARDRAPRSGRGPRRSTRSWTSSSRARSREAAARCACSRAATRCCTASARRSRGGCRRAGSWCTRTRRRSRWRARGSAGRPQRSSS